MATITHTLYSHYDPKDRERLERETGQLDDSLLLDPSTEWAKEAAQAYPKRVTTAAPRFVPAKISYDAWGDNAHSSSSKIQLKPILPDQEPDSLFKSLPRSKAESEPPTRPSPVVTFPPTAPIAAPKPQEKVNKNNWFIMKAIRSEVGSVSEPVTPIPTPTLADILSREPPPLPSEAKHKPPVWMAIGPFNKGFSMLQRSGWNEGETLGPYAARRKPEEPTLPNFLGTVMDDTQRGDSSTSRPVASSSKHTLEVKFEDFGDDIAEVKQVDVVDLTLSSDSEPDVDEKKEPSSLSTLYPQPLDKGQDPNIPGVSGHGGRALLTPIATVLKADRMGIGLKPKTIAGPAGAYRIPQKRVTHNAAALAAHIRAGEELRRQKKEGGRGRRAFDRQRKKEATERKAMLAYLNS